MCHPRSTLTDLNTTQHLRTAATDLYAAQDEARVHTAPPPPLMKFRPELHCNQCHVVLKYMCPLCFGMVFSRSIGISFTAPFICTSAAVLLHWNTLRYPHIVVPMMRGLSCKSRIIRSYHGFGLLLSVPPHWCRCWWSSLFHLYREGVVWTAKPSRIDAGYCTPEPPHLVCIPNLVPWSSR